VRKYKRESSIIDSALKMFAKNGYYNTTIAQIAKNINMSVGNIYNYFPSKNNLAKASIIYVTKKLASNLRDINNKKISSKDKIELFVTSYLKFVQKYPEMIDYFFKVYISNREVFCEENDCGFKLAEDFVSEIERLIDDGIDNDEFKEQNFYVAFSCITGVLGGITFLNSEEVLDDDLESYAKDLSRVISKALS